MEKNKKALEARKAKAAAEAAAVASKPLPEGELPCIIGTSA